MGNLDTRIMNKEKQIHQLHAEIKDLKASRKLKCKYCKRLTAIRNLILREDRQYENEPYQGLTYAYSDYTYRCPNCMSVNDVDAAYTYDFIRRAS